MNKTKKLWVKIGVLFGSYAVLAGLVGTTSYIFLMVLIKGSMEFIEPNLLIIQVEFIFSLLGIALLIYLTKHHADMVLKHGY